MDLIKMQSITVETTGSVGRIALNNPVTLNLIEKDTFHQIGEALDRFEDDSIKIVLISAVCGVSKKGKKVFSAGVNLKNYDEKIELAKADPEQFKKNLQASRALLTRIEEYKKPVVIFIDGFVTGGFFELALSCDMILATNEAVFSLNEVNIGLIPGYGGIHKLLRLVGKNRAFEIIATSRHLEAAEAFNFGIVTKVFNDEAEMFEYCRKLAEKPSESVSLVKDSIRRIESGECPEDVEVENFLQAITQEKAVNEIKNFLNR